MYLSAPSAISPQLFPCYQNGTLQSHRNSGNPWSNSMALAAPTNVLFFLSATPFCYKVWGIVCSFLIPFDEQNSKNSLEVYSPPLSALNTRIFLQVWFSTSLELPKQLKDLWLGLQEIDPGLPGIVINEGYAVTVTTERMDTLIGPHTSECTKSKGSLDFCSLCGKGFLMFFPKAKPLQWLCFSSSTWGTPMTVCLKCFSAPC